MDCHYKSSYLSFSHSFVFFYHFTFLIAFHFFYISFLNAQWMRTGGQEFMIEVIIDTTEQTFKRNWSSFSSLFQKYFAYWINFSRNERKVLKTWLLSGDLIEIIKIINISSRVWKSKNSDQITTICPNEFSDQKQ